MQYAVDTKLCDATRHPHIPGVDAHALVVLRENAVEANHKPVFATVLWRFTVIFRLGNLCEQ
jgi:hypothetical protein